MTVQTWRSRDGSACGKLGLAGSRRQATARGGCGDGDTCAVLGQRGVDRLDHPHDLEPELGGRARRRAVADRLAEVGELEGQRLASVDARRDDVSRAVREPVLAERLRIRQRHAGVEDADRLVARVVVDDHLLGADDRRPAQLARCEPRELDVRDRPRGVLEVDERDVGDARDARSARLIALDVRRGLVEPVAEDREVVRAEVPDDADVGLVQAEVHAARRDEVDLAELARLDHACGSCSTGGL